jgi:3-oxoadipate enol-lactonase
MPQVDTNGIKIEYRFDGKEGAPYITFVTGIANDLTMWDAQVAVLGKDYRTLRYDLRGHGDSQATEGDYSIQLLVRDLGGLLDELNIQKTHLVGLGLGGAIVQTFAIENSHRVNALVPCCCRAKMLPDFAALWQKLREAVANEGVEVIVEPTVQRWFSDEFKAAHPQVLQNVRNMIRGTTTLGYLGVTAAFLSLDL